MCLICVEIQKNKLTSLDARRNLSEVRTGLTKAHTLKVLKLIWKKEDEEQESSLDASLKELVESIKEDEDLNDLWLTFGGD